jgi:hypothetical protein
VKHGAFENRVLRRTFGPNRNEVRREWRKLHSEELHNFYSSPNISGQIKSRSMRWARHVARMGEEKERDHSKDRGVAGRMRSECILGILARGCRVDSVGSG